MHPRLAELLDYADRARDDLLAALAATAPAIYAVRPPDGGWTIAEVMAHLYLVEHSSVRAMFRALKNARQAGLGAETDESSLLGALDATGLKTGRGRVEAPPFVYPTEVVDLETARARLGESRDGLRAWAREADGLAIATVCWPHPRLGELNLYEWVIMIADHETRHTRQIREIARQVAG